MPVGVVDDAQSERLVGVGKFFSAPTPPASGRGELHCKPLDVHVAERLDDEVVRPACCVLPVEVGVAKVDADRHAFEALDGPVHGLHGQLDLVVDVGDPFALAIRGIDQQAQPGIVELDRVHAEGGEALDLIVDDRDAGVDELLAGGVRTAVEWSALHMRLPTV